jgi:hypothetical protein
MMKLLYLIIYIFHNRYKFTFVKILCYRILAVDSLYRHYARNCVLFEVPIYTVSSPITEFFGSFLQFGLQIIIIIIIVVVKI